VANRRARSGGAALALAAALTAVTVLPAAGGERPVPPQHLHVATWGDDAWPGTAHRPFATLPRAQREVRARTPRMTSDVVVNLHGGTYRLDAPFRLSEAAGDSGRDGHRVVYQAYGYGTRGQERVMLSGGRRVTGWRPDERHPGTWRADVGGLETRQLYVTGRRAPRPALGTGIPGRLTVTRTGYLTTSAAPLSWAAPADAEVVYRLGYVEGRCGVAAIARAGRQTSITMDEPCWTLARALYDPESMALATDVENSPTFLRPGGWYLDRSRPGHHVLRYRPRAGEDPRRAEVIAPVLETLVSGTGRPGRPLHDVTLRGLTFAHATWLAPNEPAGFPAAWSMYLRPDVDGALTVPGNVVLHAAERITIAGNRFTHLGAQGLELSHGSSHNVVDGNVFTDISDGGILMGAAPPVLRGTNRGNRVTNNWIHHVAAEYHAASGIWDTGTQETLIAHNQVNDVPYTGILSGTSDDLRGLMRGNRIVGNRVFRTNTLLLDGGGIYLRGEQGTGYRHGALVAGNAVTDHGGTEWNVGIYTDDSTNWVTVRDNVVYRYVASIGGCSEEWGDRPVSHVRYRGNHWDDVMPDWLPRRPYPGAWPAAPDCGDPHSLEFTGNTRLPAAHPDRACAARPRCAAVLAAAGPLPAYRRPLGLPGAYVAATPGPTSGSRPATPPTAVSRATSPRVRIADTAT
jgi:hypothetical protein